mmetsp:Transcript_5020/g.10137  ORF Transcript_5020/g.10137 Transcript_5020/m.10137 type:complete len:106 (+) Transcript_5020:336-653(+)
MVPSSLSTFLLDTSRCFISVDGTMNSCCHSGTPPTIWRKTRRTKSHLWRERRGTIALDGKKLDLQKELASGRMSGRGPCRKPENSMFSLGECVWQRACIECEREL